ncbi:MAG: hypothetical protein O2923_05665 [Verrucomicrobia bacterium]|nr:hypothetical protein [Verrucomicrobiota bacterium]
MAILIARGSLRETHGRYRRLRHWMPSDMVIHRMALADQINRMLGATIDTLEHKEK